MGVHCKIFVNTPRQGHIAGGFVEGTLRYSVDKSTIFKHINLHFYGRAKCSWTERKHASRRDRPGSDSITYRNKKTYVDQQISVWNKGTLEVFTVDPGIYEFAFKFKIPENSPSTYKDHNCCISHCLKLIFSKSDVLSLNKTIEQEIFVQGLVDPRGYDRPQVFGVSKTLFKIFSNKNKEILVQGVISNGYAALCEQFKLNYTVQNSSSVAVTSIKTELYSKRTATASNGRRNVKYETFSTEETPSVPAFSSAELSCIVSTSGEIYSIQNCEVVERELFLRVTIGLPIPYINASAEIPVVVGTKYPQISLAPEVLTDAPPSYGEVMARSSDGEG